MDVDGDKLVYTDMDVESGIKNKSETPRERTNETTNRLSLDSSGHSYCNQQSMHESGNRTEGHNELEIECGHGVSEEDKELSRRDKNAVDFAMNYSKLWCKCCKDIVLVLEKRAYAENEACRAIVKQFQAFDNSEIATNGAPMKQQTFKLTRMMIEHNKELETHNTKRCRGLLEVLTRQRNLVGKTRKFLKEKWKSEVKKMLDAENSLIKTKSAYYQRCQTGVKLREELSAAQNTLNELSNALASGTFVSTATMATPSGASPLSTGGGVTAGNLASEAGGDQTGEGTSTGSAAGSAPTPNQISKQRSKVERLEKQLSENDKKEIEQMYSYREAVETANKRLCELERCKMEILCDTRLAILKGDEIAKDTMAEFFGHLHSTRIAMIEQYESLSSAFQEYVPGHDYMELVGDHVQKGSMFYPEKYQFAGFHEASASGLKFDALPGRFLGRGLTSSRDANEGDPLSGIHSDSDSDGDTAANETTTSSGKPGNVLSSLVEFGSNLFRPDSKKSVRNKRGPNSSSGASTTSVHMSGSATTEALDTIAAQYASMEREYRTACCLIARCVAALERQPDGLETQGIYRVPASKAKIATLTEILQSSQPSTPEQLEDDFAVLSQEHPLTLAGLIKTRLIALPEPLLSYNLYPNFVELGKVYDVADQNSVKELVKRIQMLINHLSPDNKKLAGLVFHHLNRVASCRTENQMGAINLGTMFAPTVLRQRPKFQVANMMDLMDNKGQTRVVEVLIDQASEIFGPPSQYDPQHVLTNLASTITSTSTITTEKSTDEVRRNSGPSSSSGIGQQGGTSGRLTDKADLQVTDSRIRLQSMEANKTNPGTESTTGPGAPTQPNLLRSATISSSSTGRSSAHLGCQLPLYSSYRTSHQLNPDSAISEQKSTSNVSRTPSTLIALSKKIETSDSSETAPHNWKSSAITTGPNPSNPITLTSSIAPTSVISTTSGTSTSTTTSTTTSRSPLHLTGRQFTLSGIGKHITSSHSTSGHSTVTTTGGSSVSVSTAPGTSLTSLVIGRRRPTSMLTSSTRSTVTMAPTRSSATDSKHAIDLDDYTFIDTDDQTGP